MLRSLSSTRNAEQEAWLSTSHAWMLSVRVEKMQRPSRGERKLYVTRQRSKSPALRVASTTQCSSTRKR